jgi:hypothetical protein
MKTLARIALGGALVAALAAGTLSAQEKGDPDYGALVKSLGDEKFDARTKAYESLESAGAAARKALEEGAKSDDAQVRWSAKRLLERLEGEAKGPARVLRFGEGGGKPDLDEAFRDMDRRLGDLRRRMEDFQGFRFDLRPFRDGVRIERHAVVEKDGERIDARQDADGKVTVKIGKKDADGKAAEETFEAKDMATLEKEHPEVAKKVKGLLGDRIEIRGPYLADLPAKPALGVTVSVVPPVLRTQLSIKEGEGLVVEEVLPDTPAARLGLRRHDVILAVNGIPVSSAVEIRSAVGAVKEGGELRLRILRGGKAEEISGTR